MTISPAESSACIEMLFALDGLDYPDRIRAAAQAGHAAVEFWQWLGKDIPGLKAALDETGLRVTGFVAEPMLSLTDPANHAAFLEGLPASIGMAQHLSAPFLYIQAGRKRPGSTEAEHIAALVSVLGRAADVLQASGVTLLLEPVSDAEEGFLTHAAMGLAIVAHVNRPEVRLLYDLYHAAVAGEDLASTVGTRTHLIGHVHVADHPGRGAPGTGSLDLAKQVGWLRAHGYMGLFGLEYVPG